MGPGGAADLCGSVLARRLENGIVNLRLYFRSVMRSVDYEDSYTICLYIDR